ncbi:calpain-9-like [Antedon mediterranea]|uniref:calpain-9-like n=1 Tax=Antedon mediterranea TaxID=105859 RepID=UPI003AF773B1
MIMIKDQDYKELKRECLKTGTLFEDKEFPAVEESLFYSKSQPKPFQWKRPSEIVPNPEFIAEGASRFDIVQGMLGDCWLLSAVSSLCTNQSLFQKVCLVDQNFKVDYAGIFHFRFWQFGEWIDVVVDDRLPTYNGKLVFLHSENNNEFWSALMEKAYAKLCGSYESLKGGQTSEAMTDFTGGIVETFKLSKAPKDLFKIMQEGFARCSLMGCSIDAKPNEIESKLDNGLIKGHAYAITGVSKINAKTGSGQLDVSLVRIRNPYGNESEWTGAWSDKSAEWSLVTTEEKKQLGLDFSDDGEFWMSFDDFTKKFSKLEMCSLSPEITEPSTRSYEMSLIQHSWVKGSTAGGCRNFPDTFHTNPQFRVKLEEDDDDEEECTLVVCLMQKNFRRLKSKGDKNLTIGFSIYEIDDEFKQFEKLPKDFFLYHQTTARSYQFINSREICDRFKLPKGEYCIIPSTFKPNEVGEYLLRIFSLKKFNASEMDQQTGVIVTTKQQKTDEELEQEQAMKSKFETVYNDIAGKDELIDPFELQECLTSAFKTVLDSSKFSLGTCRSIVALRSNVGMLDFDEFFSVWMELKELLDIFKKYDKDDSENVNVVELQPALEEVGFRLSTRLVSAMVVRFGPKTIGIDDFIQCVIKLRHLNETFQKHSANGKESTFKLDEFINETML